MNNKTILLFCNFELPDSCANATRVFSFAKILKSIGYSTQICGVTYKNSETNEGEYDGFTYSNIQCPEFHGAHALKRKKIIEKKIRDLLYAQYNLVDAIVLSNVYYELSKPFLRFSKDTGIPLIVNAVEWYDYNNDLFSGLSGKIRFIQNRYALRRIYVKMNNIVAISSLLGNYYKHKRCNVCVVPTIIDCDDYRDLGHTASQKLKIAYAGNPGKKDFVTNAMKAILLLDDSEKSKIEMHFYGITVDKVLALGMENSELEQLGECVKFHGRISQEQVKEKIAEADFTILLRPDKRYANAGFPTKVGESMATGTPVIANITSDLDKYIIDGKTGLVCDDESIESCLKAIRKALNLSEEEKERMRYHTLDMAKNSFDYSNYIDTFQELLNNIFK